MTDLTQLLQRARKWPKGNHFEDFTIGQRFEHHWGRTLSESDNTLFSTLTLHFNPLYFNLEYARAHGHAAAVINPLLVFLTVFGLSVEDLSEAGGGLSGCRSAHLSSQRSCRRYAHCAQCGDGIARVGKPSTCWDRQLAYRRLQSTRRARHRFPTHQHGEQAQRDCSGIMS